MHFGTKFWIIAKEAIWHLLAECRNSQDVMVFNEKRTDAIWGTIRNVARFKVWVVQKTFLGGKIVVFIIGLKQTV